MQDIIEAKYVLGYKIELTFEDGEKGIVDFSEYKSYGGVFEPFNDLEYFKRFKIDEETKTLVWPGDLDIDPEVLYHKATGKPLPVWAK